MTIADKVNEYLVIKSSIRNVKTIQRKMQLKELLYEKYDNAYLEEERLKYINASKKDIKEAHNRQKKMLKYINKLNNVKIKND